LKLKIDNKGFIFVEVIFLALILSFTAILVVNHFETAIKSNRVSIIRMAAIHLANAKMAEIEQYNFDKPSFQIPSETFLSDRDLNYKNTFGIKGDVKFSVGKPEVVVENKKEIIIYHVTIKVTWSVNGNTNYGNGNDNNFEEITKDIVFKSQSSTS